VITESASTVWVVGRDRSLLLDRPRIIGILNVTPDSFSDGGQYADVADALAAAELMHAQGADAIDVGGESTRPGAAPVDIAEQIRRTQPVIAALRQRFRREELLISIDTTRAAVAQAALDSGADVINDISAGLDDPDMLPLAASRACGLILMHRRTTPARDFFSHQYTAEPDYGNDVVGAVRSFLEGRAHEAVGGGINQKSIVIDPGLGFGKSVDQNYELAGRMQELAGLNYHVLSAASRKSFIGAAINEPVPSRRVSGSIAMSVAHWMMGVRLFRVHDVQAHRQALDVAMAITAAKPMNPSAANQTFGRQACYHDNAPT
jgi:dihydropteroate synthase